MKTDNKHTPTPYSISGIPGDNHIMARWRGGKITVAIAIGHPEITTEEFEANKAFIVAACNSHAELVEALTLAQATIERLTVRHGPFSSTDGTLDAIKAALQKAGAL